MLGAGGLFLAALSYFVWSVQNEWGSIIESRINEQNSISSIRVLAQDESGNEKWIGALSAGRLEERMPVTLSEIPPLLTQAIVTLEDPRFLNHEGIDTFGIARAMWANIKSLRYAQGGSTITQQLVKNVFLTNEKTIKRKLTEFVLAALVEKNFDKDAILEAYMNEIYYGQIGAYEVHGVARAANYYFGKELEKLELHEMALVAALAKGPGYYDPWRHPHRATDRRNFVLRKLVEKDLILEEEYIKAQMQPLPARKDQLAQVRAPYLMDALRNLLIEREGESALLKGSFDIKLTLDLSLQKLAEEALAQRAKEWAPELQGAFIAADPRTCAIKAYVGGTEYRISQLDHIRQIQRAMGSLMKPLTLHHLLNSENENYNLATSFDDSPYTWSFDKGRSKWAPQNYDKKFRGLVSIRQILEQSLNVPLTKIFHKRTPEGLLWNEFNSVRALGLEIPQERALPSALLGSIEQSPWRVMEAYLRLTRMALGLATDAADLECQLHFEDLDSRPPQKSDEKLGENAYGQKGARLVIAALEGGFRRGTSASLGTKVSADQQWGGKTGTSSDLRDSWYVAVSPNLVALSWVGRDDNKETKFTGASGALPIVRDVLVPYSQKLEGWEWPHQNEFEWKVVERDRFCLAKTADIMTSSGPISTTPPPEDFMLNGVHHYWELFHEDSLPIRCEEL